MWASLIFVLVIAIYILFEYRFRKPDQIVLYESKGNVQNRISRIYPRHFSLVIPGTIHSLITKIETEAKGKITVKISLAITCAISPDNLPDIIRVGGWNKDAVNKAAKELEIILHSVVKEYSEKYEIEGLISENLSNHLQDKLVEKASSLGLMLVSLNVQSIDPVDEEIAEAMKQQETARIMEQTELANQTAKINARKIQIEADEKIAISEHELEMKKCKLKKEQEEKNAEIANQRVKDELERRKLQLEIDRKEIELIKDNPELMVLSPQVARLAEASQSLRNARTVVNLSANDAAKGTQVLDLLQAFLQNMVQGQVKDSEGEKNK